MIKYDCNDDRDIVDVLGNVVCSDDGTTYVEVVLEDGEVVLAATSILVDVISRQAISQYKKKLAKKVNELETDSRMLAEHIDDDESKISYRGMACAYWKLYQMLNGRKRVNRNK